MSSLADVVLQLIESLNGDANNVLVVGPPIHAEIAANVGACPAYAIVARLAREPYLVCGVSQHAVCRDNVKPSRDDHG